MKIVRDITKYLIAKSIAGLCFLLFVLGLIIFLPAWTLNYFQAWLYLCTFAVSVILITIYLVKKDPKLLERRVKAVPTAETEKTQKKIVSLLNIFFIFIFIVAGLDFRYRWSYLPLYISLFADVFVALGFYIVFRVFKENSFTSGIIEVAEDQKVISTGPYRIVRHPMYAGALLMLFFTPLVLDSYWAIICVIPLSVSIAARAIDEEKFLIKNLSGYEEYCQKVQYRLIPLIW